MTEIGLAAALEELRQELYEAQDRSAGEQFGFVVNEAQLELLLELRNTGKADGKLTFGVAAVGAAGEHTTVRTHKLTLKLAIRDRAAGDANPEISHNDTRAWTED